MNIGTTIKSVRESRNLKQIELAKLSKLTQSYLSLVESGIKYPSPQALKRIGKALNVPEQVLILLSIEQKDVPLKKREVFKVLIPTIESMIKSLFLDDNLST